MADQAKLKRWKNGITAVMVLLIFVVVAVCAKLFLSGQVDSVDSLQNYLDRFGAFGPIALMLFQALQVIIPVVPGFVGPIVGTIMFGPVISFITNYVGITAGSIISYYLARKFGIDIVLLMFSEKKYNKWANKIGKSKYYDWILFIGTLLPLFPDDFLCYFSGLINMDAKKFNLIMILGKPWCILGYALLMHWVPEWLPGIL